MIVQEQFLGELASLHTLEKCPPEDPPSRRGTNFLTVGKREKEGLGWKVALKFESEAAGPPGSLPVFLFDGGG